MPVHGFPLRIPNRSLTSVFVVEPTLGVDLSQPSVDIAPGATPASENYIMREGALEPRPMLSLYNDNPSIVGSPILGGAEIIDVSGNRYPLTSSRTQVQWYSNGSWSALSYVSAGGVDDPPSLSATQYWDWGQIYYVLGDENIAIGGTQSYQTLYCWQSNTTVFSSLTGAPKARYVAGFDNYVLAANIQSESSVYVQRIQWSDRGSASSWTGGLSGFEDILAMKGDITGLIPLENRVLVMGENEIWHGYPVDFPFIFRFEPLDQSVGCPYPWTAVRTPQGVVFLGTDYHIYVIPKQGGQAVPIGQRLHPYLRNAITQPERAWGTFDHVTSTYQLNYPIKGGSGYPQKAVWLNLDNGSWAPQSYDPVSGSISVTRGFPVEVSSGDTSWADLTSASVTWADLAMSWAELAGASEERAILVGSSNGTLYFLNSNATSDNGTAVKSYWQSSALGGDTPTVNKTITRLAFDYQADSSSSLTVRFSASQGGSFNAGIKVDLPQSSAVSQAVAHAYVPSRYPTFRVESEGFRYRLYRFLAEMRFGGRR